MRFLIDIPRGSHQQVALAASHGLRALARINYDLLVRFGGRIPRLYETSVQFRPEPGAGEPGVPEQFDHLGLVLARGWGDCDDLVGWRLAECWFFGEPMATERIIWPLGWPHYHAQLRRADKTIEDPSAVMRRKNG